MIALFFAFVAAWCSWPSAGWRRGSDQNVSKKAKSTAVFSL